jgi:hypothetical protein
LRVTASARAALPLFLAAGLALACVAHADGPFTLKCSGQRSWTAGAGSVTESPEHVINYYTLRVTGETGFVYGWHEHRWNMLRAGDPAAYTLEREGQGMNWRLSIGRGDGAWSEVWAGHQHTIRITGHCVKVALREPPAPPDQ